MSVRMFLGGNTADGFKSYFEERLAPMKKIYILKGGAGTGKSTLMKKVADFAEAEKLKTQLWYCSGDVKSLDGVCLVDKGIAIVDGTAPHVVEAKYPAVRDKLIALGDYIDEGKVLPHYEEIASLCSEKMKRYNKAYRYLKTAKFFEDTINEDCEIIRPKLVQICSKVAYEVRKLTKITRQFMSAISPQGVVSFDDCLEGKQLISLYYEYPKQREQFFEILTNMLCGYEAYMNPLGSGIDCLVVGRYAIIPYVSQEAGEVVDLNLALKRTPSDMAYEKGEFERNLSYATDELSKAREAHLKVEDIYIPAMDFDGVNSETEKVLKEIFS